MVEWISDNSDDLGDVFHGNDVAVLVGWDQDSVVFNVGFLEVLYHLEIERCFDKGAVTR